jgi:hypothetical protein
VSLWGSLMAASKLHAEESKAPLLNRPHLQQSLNEITFPEAFQELNKNKNAEPGVSSNVVRRSIYPEPWNRQPCLVRARISRNAASNSGFNSRPFYVLSLHTPPREIIQNDVLSFWESDLQYVFPPQVPPLSPSAPLQCAVLKPVLDACTISRTRFKL